MNEIIVDFDQILDDEKFRAIEKIKTIGCTYMAASGINPQEDERDELAHLCDLVDFAIEMRNKLEDINTHSFPSNPCPPSSLSYLFPTILLDED